MARRNLRRSARQRGIDLLTRASARALKPSRGLLERIFIDGVSSPRIARTVARLADGKTPGLRAWIRLFIRTFDVDMTDVESVDRYESFNDFFARRLRPETRPLDPEAALISPCDGRLTATGVADNELTIVKGRRARLGPILDDVGLDGSERSATVIYLSPRDYHRVHTPVSGRLDAIVHKPGTHYPVNGLGLRHHPNALTTNERVTFLISSPSLGQIVVAMVGAANVSSILPSVHLGMQLEAGAELGAFHLGSTVVVFADARLACQRFEGESLRLGEPLLTEAT